ncbi:MAG: NUDIX hydrolase [Synergistetes bacterium]|nr:NUDIX hydrolase [Synergistota bacterium]
MEKELERRLVYQGRVVNLRVDEVMLPDGRRTRREVVEHRGAVVILPITRGGEIVMVRQYRYPVGEELLELPAGTLELGEDPQVCAERELTEETGYKAGSIRLLTSYYSSPGFCTERLYLFLATDLEPGSQKLESDERIKVELYSLDEVKDKVRCGEIKDAKSVAGILYYVVFESR